MDAVQFQAQPTISQLNRLIDKVPKYPISIGKLIELAKTHQEPAEVQAFYKTFAKDMVFDDRDELKDRSEQVEILREEGKDMPPEQMFAPEEY